MNEIRCKGCGAATGKIETRNKKICFTNYSGNRTLIVYEDVKKIHFYCPNITCQQYGIPQKIEVIKSEDKNTIDF